ncbi:MAG: hypothetical protein WAK17_05615 [Candidatus Nitrosopolaris sp.]
MTVNEARITNDIVHKNSKDIVNSALETNSLIVLGNLRLEKTKHGKET